MDATGSSDKNCKMSLFAICHILIISALPVWCLGEQILYISNQKTSWNQARATCESLGYRILDVTSEVIQNVLMHYSTDSEWESTIVTDIWIGVHNSQLTSSVDFRYGDCSPVTWSNWENAQPVKPAIQMCAALEHGTLKWITKPCSDTDVHVACMTDGGDCEFDIEYSTECTTNGLAVQTFEGIDTHACGDKCETTTKNGMDCWLYQWESSTLECTIHFHTNPYFCDDFMKWKNNHRVGVRECFDILVQSWTISGPPPNSVPLVDCGQQTTSATTTSMTTIPSLPAPQQTSSITDPTSTILSQQAVVPSGTAQTSTSLPTTFGTPLMTISPSASNQETSLLPESNGSAVSVTMAFTTPEGNGYPDGNGGANGYVPSVVDGDPIPGAPPLVTSVVSAVPSVSAALMTSAQTSILSESTASSAFPVSDSVETTAQSVLIQTSILPASPTPSALLSTAAMMQSSTTSLLPSLPKASAATSQTSVLSASPAQSAPPASDTVESTVLAASILPSVPTSQTTTILNSAYTTGITTGLSCDSCSFSTCIYPRNTSLIDLQRLLDNLLLDAHNLSSYRRKKKTEMDQRLSATGLGVTGIIIICLWCMFFVVMDTTRLVCKPNRRRWNV